MGMKKVGGKKSLNAAIIMIIMLAAAMAVMVFVNSRRSAEDWTEYENAIVQENKEKEARLKAEKEKEARIAEAKAEAEAAMNSFLPSVVFLSDRSFDEPEDGGIAYPFIVRTLLMKNVGDIPIRLENVLELSASAEGGIPVVFLKPTGSAAGDIARIGSFVGDNERFIVIGAYEGDASQADAENQLAQQYGNRYINLREYFSTDGMPSLNLTVSSEDEAAMSAGKTPPGLLGSDGASLNYSGQKLVAFLTFDRMTRLGYFDEVIKAAENYQSEVDKK